MFSKNRTMKLCGDLGGICAGITLVTGRQQGTQEVSMFVGHATSPLATGPMIGQDNEHVSGELPGLSATHYHELIEQQIVY